MYRTVTKYTTQHGIMPSAFIGYCGSLRLEWIIIEENVQLVWKDDPNVTTE
jgi:hypothetical protein